MNVINSVQYVHSVGRHGLIPRPPCPAFVACSTKSGGKAWKDYHVMHAATDVTRLSLARIHVCAIAIALSMLASTAEKATRMRAIFLPS